LNRRFTYTICSLVILCCHFSYAQFNLNLKKSVSKKINFELAGNIIIIPLEINGVTLSFVLDTGVNKAILFSLTKTDTLQVKNTKTIYLQGLGSEGKIEALKSSQNKFKIGDAIGFNKDLYVLLDNSITFTPRLGILVHGIIGYDIFKDFVVEINYASKFIRLHRPDKFKTPYSKHWQSVPIDITNNKPFVKSLVHINDTKQEVKLLIDTGSSYALWLFEDDDKQLYPNKDILFRDFLGKGLSGSVYGQRSRIAQFQIGDYSLHQVNVAFPDSSAIDVARIVKGRNGSIGGGVLKRFNVFFDYHNKTIHLKKNRYFKDPFTYNNSGIVLEYNGTQFVREAIKLPKKGGYQRNEASYNSIQIDLNVSYMLSVKPVYVIAELRESSNAYKAGLRIGDILTRINGKQAYEYKLPKINELLHGKTGKTIRLKVQRNGIELPFKFKLDDVFNQKKEPSK